MQIEYAAAQHVTLTPADQFVLQFMMGMIGQGHGHQRVRGIVPALKYLRMQYGLSLADAKSVVLEWEKSARAVL